MKLKNTARIIHNNEYKRSLTNELNNKIIWPENVLSIFHYAHKILIHSCMGLGKNTYTLLMNCKNRYGGNSNY